MLFPYQPHFCIFWLHFGFIFESFWVHLGAKWRWRPSFGGSRSGGATTSWKIVDFGVVLGSPWASFFVKNQYFFGSKNAYFFWCVFWSFWGPFWEAFGVHFASKNLPGEKNAILWKWAFRIHESLILEGQASRKPSKRLRKSIPKWSRFFHRKNIEKMSENWSSKDPWNLSKSVPKPPWKNV